MVTTDRFQDVRWMHVSNANNCLYVVDNLKIKKVTPFGKVETIITNLQRPKGLVVSEGYTPHPSKQPKGYDTVIPKCKCKYLEGKIVAVKIKPQKA